jgi:hypothetical protein
LSSEQLLCSVFAAPARVLQITQGLFPREQRETANQGILLTPMKRSDHRSGRKQRNRSMTNDTQLLNDTELATVAGGVTSLIRTSTIEVPNIPRDKDLLTPQQIAKVLSVIGGFNPPIPRS